jgi:hypothetical protein
VQRKEKNALQSTKKENKDATFPLPPESLKVRISNTDFQQKNDSVPDANPQSTSPCHFGNYL